MSIKGFRVNETEEYHENSEFTDKLMEMKFVEYFHKNQNCIEFHTGTYDRNGKSIYEGDMLRSMTCEIPFKVENIVDFLLMCGEYRAKNGCDIFDSLEIVNES